jgi:hypothetical protein
LESNLRNASNLPGPAGSSISSKITEVFPSETGIFFSRCPDI